MQRAAGSGAGRSQRGTEAGSATRRLEDETIFLRERWAALERRAGVEPERPRQRAKILQGFHPSDLADQGPAWTSDNGNSDLIITFPPMWETWVGLTGGMTALLHAAREGHIEAAEALLDAGADIDQVGGDGSSPLVIAIFNGRYDMAMKLLERGANPNLATSVEGAGPLFALIQTQYAGLQLAQPQPRAHEQQQVEYLTVLNALLDAGADPNLRLRSHPWYWEFETGSRLGLDLTGATLLARSALYAHQAFRYGRSTYGLQFHAEVTPAIFRRWQTDHAPRYTGKPGVQHKDEQDRSIECHDPAQHAWFTGFLDRLFGEGDAEWDSHKRLAEPATR